EWRIDQAERDHLEIQRSRQNRMRIQFAAESVAGPETGTRAIDQGIARAFERQVGRDFGDFEAMLLEPSFEMRFFALSLPMKETAQHNLLPNYQAGIGGEHHIRQARLRWDLLHLCLLLQQL